MTISSNLDNTVNTRITLGISACLLGEKVRYDGHHKYNGYIVETLGAHFDLSPFCPEVAAGLGVPRPTIRLVGKPATPQAVGTLDPNLNVTNKLERLGRRTAREMKSISGYILKARSPSCGMERVSVYPPKGPVVKKGVGRFAAKLMESNALLPIEEEGRLNDPELRDNFIERVFAYQRWQQLNSRRLTPKRLSEFHAAQKLCLMAHSPQAYRQLGQLISSASTQPLSTLKQTYATGLMDALNKRATPAKHCNVMQHILGYLKKSIDAEDKQELLELIDAFRQGQSTRAAPLTLLRHHFRKHPNGYIRQQHYLFPSPDESILRGL
ncbi:hypothetical protein BOW53_00075 [Solemya pervernicosa gill symbiont]|uniref:DUF1722 domain-containing protein n=2 Tax=Gammaproteobacteria incertae sedis TaxID=118884 RepID=A0A1T2LAZ6_9GAMM|nr:DUF523 and DUF1722 domain-containing protein [Candidatus Reidiella endopervernicosa]OOZ42278.1 hypothetical protein BOW53_00075 [Solemya pervernicosa gill symbiont]QKQ25674.1 DUF523 and DUF1722 domain-containing protein [Candidatus Reidiella endopervernicosa]